MLDGDVPYPVLRYALLEARAWRYIGGGVSTLKKETRRRCCW